jgi:DNA mismatch endonuclease (patch repair protein)
MADTFTIQKRSEIMAAVKSRGNKSTELQLISVFRANGMIGWRRGQKLPGKPDFVFPRERIALFVDGCFWHGCPIHCRKPNSNSRYWLEKIARNQGRDFMVRKRLRKMGWRVVRVWEHEFRLTKKLAEKLKSKLYSSREQCNYPPQ